MSRALELAKRMLTEGQVASLQLEMKALSPQEQNLVFQASKTLEGMGASSWQELEMIARALDEGGYLDNPEVGRFQFVKAAKMFIKHQEDIKTGKLFNVPMPGADSISESNVCIADVSSLRECTIKQLFSSKGKPAEGRVLWVDQVEESFKTSAVQLCVQDKKGLVINLSLYNFVPPDNLIADVQKLFRVGTRLGIKHPYLKLSNSGKLTLRVDNPCNVIITNPTSNTNEEVTELKAQGNARVGAKDYTGASELYTLALEAAAVLQEALHSNRAFSRLSLTVSSSADAPNGADGPDYVGALADCEQVLKRNPTHAKALQRKEQAVQGLQHGGFEPSVPPDSVEKSSASKGAVAPPPPPPSESVEAPVAHHTVASSTRTSASASVEGLKARGNACVAQKDFAQSIQYYTQALDILQSLLEALYSNRALVRLHLGDYDGVLRDCEAVLALNPTHAKTLTYKDKAQQGLELCKQQREGKFAFHTLSFDPALQEGVQNYYGPIEVRKVPQKGRGLVVTRDVPRGTLLLVEKALATRDDPGDDFILAANFSTRKVNPGSQHFLVSNSVMQAHSDRQFNTILSFLAYDKINSSTTQPAMPSIEWFRCGSFPEEVCVPPLSAERITGVVSVNAFQYTRMKRPPTQAEKDEMAVTLAPNVDRDTFLSGYYNRMGQLAMENSRGVQSKSRSSHGTALWGVVSFMNHDARPSVTKEVFGKLMVVHALRDMCAGEELTIMYSDDAETLRSHWGIAQ